jgi:hypothetical protein
VGDTVEIRGESNRETVQIFGGPGARNSIALDRAPGLAMSGAAGGQ